MSLFTNQLVALGNSARDRRASNSHKSTKARSSSESRVPKVDNRRRTPYTQMQDLDDVPTAVCVEISVAFFKNPEMNTGTFFNTLSNSARDLNKHDTTIVSAAAILIHCGNDKAGTRLLEKSATCTSIYNQMGFNSPKTREMFVTMLFTMNPNFANMLCKTMELSMKRASELRGDNYSIDQLKKTIQTLANNEYITIDDLKTKANSVIEMPAMIGFNSSSLDKADSVAPSDSVTSLGSPSRRDKVLPQKEIMEYVRRRKSGREPAFSEVFKDVTQPISVKPKNNKLGLGANSLLTEQNLINDMTDMNYKLSAAGNMGSHTVPSVNIKTGNVRRRKPRVEDYLDSEEVSNAVFDTVPDNFVADWNTFDSREFRQPSPTDLSLKETAYETTIVDSRELKQKDSIELLMESLNIS